MNYYLARNGETYGPYPEESFPAMLAEGQVVPEDMVCAEGGTAWLPLSEVPSLNPYAASAAPGSRGAKLRVSAPAPRTEAPHIPTAASPAYSAPAGSSRPESSYDLWGTIKLALYGVGALVVLGLIAVGYFRSQREHKEIAKLQSEPGWKAFDAANRQLDTDSGQGGHGNTSDATQLSTKLAIALGIAQQANFKIEKKSRYRGRSKLGRAISAAKSATADPAAEAAAASQFQLFSELRPDRAIFLVRVPEFSAYKGEARQAMRQLCWEVCHVGIQSAVRKNPDLALLVGLRDDDDSYDGVYALGNLGDASIAGRAPPKAASGNVPSHQLLVKWFGEEKPQL